MPSAMVQPGEIVPWALTSPFRIISGPVSSGRGCLCATARVDTSTRRKEICHSHDFIVNTHVNRRWLQVQSVMFVITKTPSPHVLLQTS